MQVTWWIPSKRISLLCVVSRVLPYGAGEKRVPSVTVILALTNNIIAYANTSRQRFVSLSVRARRLARAAARAQRPRARPRRRVARRARPLAARVRGAARARERGDGADADVGARGG